MRVSAVAYSPTNEHHASPSQSNSSANAFWSFKSTNPSNKKMKLNTLMRPAITIAIIGSAILGKLTAAPITVPDFSFEKTLLADGATGGALNAGTNWSAAGNTAAFLGGVYLMNSTNEIFAGTTGDLSPLPAPGDGTNALFMSLGTSKGYAWQDVGVLQS